MRDEMVMMGLPRPGKTLLWLMGALLAIWIMFAVAINWAHVDPRAFELFAGNTRAIFHGEIWRLATAPFLHAPNSIEHILYVLMGLYFLGPSLEARWGARRTILFLIGAALMGFGTQMAAEILLPRSLADGIRQEYWFGAMGVVEAIAVAWALSNRHQTVRLFFVLPVSGTGLLVFVIGVSLLAAFAGRKPSEGLMTTFGGMLAGYLFGAGDPTPARRWYLKLRYRWIARRAAKFKTSQPRLRVIEGGEPSGSRRKPPTDKRFLN